MDRVLSKEQKNFKPPLLVPKSDRNFLAALPCANYCYNLLYPGVCRVLEVCAHKFGLQCLHPKHRLNRHHHHELKLYRTLAGIMAPLCTRVNIPNMSQASRLPSIRVRNNTEGRDSLQATAVKSFFRLRQKIGE